ncbi:hypothetical protein AB1Y20_021544 [Prymnesium parvum]|uniref:Fe2OG dioxygenase domain-containing protein n=1 Tax=Prymnesium parvum TaxID=97485 RepID=A0AB34JLI4_PRYPA
MQAELGGLDDARGWAQLYAASNGAPSARSGRSTPENTPPCIISQLFSREEVEQCLQAAARIGSENPFAPGELCAALDGRGHDVGYSGEHIATYLHKDAYFQTGWPLLYDKLLRAMRSQPGYCDDPALQLRLRCIELHSYAVGGGLYEPGHCDCGSLLSMSVLLSDPEQDGVAGGQFVTWTNGEPVVHAMRGGDAVLFKSRKAHNIATVTHGMRQSLVIELWIGGTNTRNRDG